MADTEDKLADWWVKWREADFTWAGLVERELQGWVVADGLLREAEFDAETRFRVRAARGDAAAGLALLDMLDAAFEAKG